MKLPIVPLLVALILLMVVSSAAFVVDQGEQGIIVQFGEPVGEVASEPGLHWKTPFIQEVRYFDKRLLVWDGSVSQIPTLGREFVLVDTTARWRIVDPLQFLRSVRDENGARTRLDDIIDSVARDIISGTNLEEIVRSRDWNVDIKAIEDESMVREDVDLLGKPKKGRALLEKEILAAASERMPEMGIELVDVRLKRINYIESVGAQVESRMISERQSIAERFRSEGQGKSQEILGEMEERTAQHPFAGGTPGRRDSRQGRWRGNADLWRGLWRGSRVLRLPEHAGNLQGARREHHPDDRRELGVFPLYRVHAQALIDGHRYPGRAGREHHPGVASFRPMMPVTISATLARRSVFAGSSNSTMPSATVPIAPTPTHTL